MLFQADQLKNFFGQQDKSVMPVQHMFGFEPTVVYFPLVFTIVILLFLGELQPLCSYQCQVLASYAFLNV
jgi:hypothetical protein